MSKTLSTLFFWAVLSAAIGWWLGPATGWGLFALGLLLLVLIGAFQLQKIQRWVTNLDAPPPPSVGPWDDILAPIYRKLKQNRLSIHDQNRHIESMMMAAEALPDGAVTLNNELHVQWCNKSASQHLGLNLATDRQQSIFNIVRSPEFAHYAQGRDWDHSLTLHTHQGGEEKTLALHLTPYGLGQFLLVSRDITQMEKLETTRKDFVANVSHELRTPLTVLLGFLETLQDMPADSLGIEQRARYEQMMIEQAQHMQAIVADLLTLSTLESSPTADQSAIAVTHLIEQALTRAHALSEGQHVFVTALDDTLWIEGSETELSSAISNLLTNAVRYTPKDGTITTSWFINNDGTATFSVQDTGIGIAPQDIPRLTERFYRADKGRSRATGGTGLGLAITRHVVSRHQAELEIKSRYAAGSTFSIHFPVDRVRIHSS
ncbi:phosphate regulon sensor histidine kinase PhoR [Paenalcaligenes hominis]|uniref:phosphate regulon sensor histidine kinase PhoR n=1 Tax=Paenalcaligenes hominis TaxID=643674 RepID=UPI001430B323|nr:phosphate regulon sensor histidine kinase PhoR [Paenalcaligenes hominis]GGE57603.1 phosphate regulon sensor histidine kinase PhoR [Paenalcaligenes hominis]